LPHPRAGARQRVCSAPDCQKERHRRACARWHEKTPDYDRERRLRERLRAPEATGTEVAPLRALRWDVARDAVGTEAAVIIEETAEVLVRWARDAVIRQPLGTARKFDEEVRKPARDEMVRSVGPP
jgi:hypothetical protein